MLIDLESILNRHGWFTFNGHAEYCGMPQPQFPATDGGERRAAERARAAKHEETRVETVVEN
jgi:broad specificity phosphatase PhoE